MFIEPADGKTNPSRIWIGSCLVSPRPSPSIYTNEAMDGRNLFESRGIKTIDAKFAGPYPRADVFISHSRLDKQKARAVAKTLEASEVDYYFDENDEQLQLADEQNDDLKIVRCIENGIEVCSHLLGIITENTCQSWWVPYEIGSATGRKRGFAHLIDKEVNKLPSYMKAAKILANREELRKWLPSEANETSGFIELARRIAELLDYPDFVPADRSVNELTFY